jgi:hypothetical protein
MSTTSVRELGYLFLTESSLHEIASDLDVKDHTAMDEFWTSSSCLPSPRCPC